MYKPVFNLVTIPTQSINHLKKVENSCTWEEKHTHSGQAILSSDSLKQWQQQMHQ